MTNKSITTLAALAQSVERKTLNLAVAGLNSADNLKLDYTVASPVS